ncbi:uncharacterized protein A4U43_C01F27640 [Asparagus officinalis]|uniref:Uncharacterized protein n=1 Tax=Asparagus officinalis TaxID=4686 RepID=A0A5P1FSL8_ASPOF|nr:uncharacterized protein LOC109843841 [Asparagus officinalis]ONK81306.1 uncharacterized protein A4U43_C01F27640 [Asparagus officinalis]
MSLVKLLLSSLIAAAAAAISTSAAVQYSVINNAAGTPGGDIFNNQIGVSYTSGVLSDSTSFIWTIFNQNVDSERKSVDHVTLIVNSFNGVAYTSNDEIHVSSDYIAGYSGDVKGEITGVLYHEMTHVWQWDGQGKAPGGLIEGIADYVRLKANYVPSHWVKPGEGQKWDQGYDVTARFLDYCGSVLSSGFVAQLNAKMRDGYSDDFFMQLLGKGVDQLWSDYKAYYGKQ